MAGRHYYYRRQRPITQRRARLENAVTFAVIVLVIAVLVLFLFVYHDFPLRVTGQ